MATPRPRLAWFAPLPPERSGVAAYNAELLPRLGPDYAIDVFIEAATWEPCDGVAVRPAHDFVWRHIQAPYDLVVYQLGNAVCHDYMWPYLFRYPGLVVLHDGQLHHARARALLARGRYADYQVELRFEDPDGDAGLLDMVRYLGPLTYEWPMVRAVVEGARLVAVHNVWFAEELAEAHPGAPIDVVEMGVSGPSGDPTAAAATVRARHGIPPEAVLFAAFGGVTPEKRIPEILSAVQAVARTLPNIRFIVVGSPASYYDVMDDARTRGVADRVVATGYVPDDELDAYTAAADICLCLRWPSGRESSASWLRCLAAGRCTVITDLAQTVEVTSLDPRVWTALQLRNPDVSREPICVSIDIEDELHSLRLAIRGLATDAALRDALGRRGREFWHAGHTLEHMADGYRRVIPAARAAGAGTAPLPPHLRLDGTERARKILEQCGVGRDPFIRS